MPALPLPEVPPPDTPDDHGPNPRVGSARERTGSPVSATVRLCLVDPAADADEIVTAAVSMITTTYTAPGDRIMFVDGEAPATSRSRRVGTGSWSPSSDSAAARPPHRTTALTAIMGPTRRVGVCPAPGSPNPDSDRGPAA
ncbi:hypothetical protein [Saccharopolyspora sp. NPDC049357]|uniref:hypothetical protein n=1 Tax=Saccharopolyspora sp. NPDC049357 TaxID=3154507 RepID=UPI003426DA81